MNISVSAALKPKLVARLRKESLNLVNSCSRINFLNNFQSKKPPVRPPAESLNRKLNNVELPQLGNQLLA